MKRRWLAAVKAGTGGQALLESLFHRPLLLAWNVGAFPYCFEQVFEWG
jgi:hypothetical protein